MTTRWRSSVGAGIAGVLAVVTLGAGGLLLYLRAEVLDRQAFEERAVTALDDPAVRRVVADQIVAEVIARAEPDLITARPLLRAAVGGLIESDPFRSVLRVAAADAHRLLFERRRDEVRVELAGLASVMISTLRSIDPRLAEALPPRLEVELAQVTVADLAGGIPRAAHSVREGATWITLAGGLLLALSLLLAVDRRRTALRLAAGLVGAAVLVAVLTEARPRAGGPVGTLSKEQADRAVSATWSAFTGDLRSAALMVATAGMLGIAMAGWGAPLPPRWRERFAEALRRRPSTTARLVRAGALGLLACGLALASSSTSRALVLAAVVAVALVAVDELLGGGVARDAPARLSPRRAPRIAWAAVAVALLAGIVLVALSRDTREIPLDPSRAAEQATRSEGCNGSVPACAARLNEIVFPGTHNSMSAASSPGWVFTNQGPGIGEQLTDGIRLLMLDAHWGGRSGARVRTDLLAEGTTLNRAARALGPERIAAASRLAGQIGLGRFEGRDGVYLCHTLCELGATPIGKALDDLREFLEGHPHAFVVVMFESSVSGRAIAKAFESADLVDRSIVLQRGRPVPTLGEALAEGRQLLVFGDRETEGWPWLHDMAAWIQDTPVGGSSCDRRSGSSGAPFLAVNHWIDEFPPRPSQSASIGGADRLRERIARCSAALGPPGALIAVDYYRQTSVIEIARARNEAAP